jgi:uncharacterized coiled-coil protein SlyX
LVVSRSSFRAGCVGRISGLSRAVDQLQVVQDQLVAQRAETKRLSEQIAELTEKLDALQQSVANLPAPSNHAAGSPPAPPKPP